MKLPSFPFYVKDWLASSRVRMMTLAHRGAYLELLCHDWDTDGLLNDDDALATLSCLGDNWFNGAAQIIKPCFVNHPAKVGYLTNPRLQQIRLEYLEHREERRRSGRLGAQKRWGQDVPVEEWFSGRKPDGSAIDLPSPPDSSAIDLPLANDGSSLPLVPAPSGTKLERDISEVVIPTLQEVQEWGKMDGVPPEVCAAFFNHYQGLGWMYGRTAIRYPRLWLKKFMNARQRAPATPKKESAGSLVFQKKTRLQALERVLEEHPAAPNSNYSDPPSRTQKQEYEQLNAEAKKLRHELATGVVS